MNEQSFKNHSRYIIVWHFLTSAALGAVLVGSIIKLVNAPAGHVYSAAMAVVTALILISYWWYARVFALKAQDRAIRAEENFRHFILTGKPFPADLRIGQIIALRFASDDEFPALVKRAVSEKLAARQIKEAIQHWRPDNYRV